MKRTITYLTMAALTLVFTAFSAPVLAQCSQNYGVLNPISGGQLDIAGTLDDGSGTGSIRSKFWIQGQADVFHSGSLPTHYQVFPWGTNSYYIWTSWDWVPGLEECPSPKGRTVHLYSIANGGQGQYLLSSAAFNEYYESWDFDQITNGDGYYGPNTTLPKSIPVPAASVLPSPTSNDVLRVGLTWSVTRNLYGFYDSPPEAPVVTGMAVRYVQSAAPPASFKVKDWMLASFVDFARAGGDPGFTQVDLPAAPGMTTYVAFSLVFDGGRPGFGDAGLTETDFVGGFAALAPAPASAPTFDQVAASSFGTKVQLKYVTRSEADVKYYTVLSARTAAGPFKAATGPRSPNGGAGPFVYLESMAGSTGPYLQVAATLSDGTTAASPVVRVLKAARR
ncbi:MAG: hypothetical protein AB1347_08040 [Acidobacteriota bacterium]